MMLLFYKINKKLYHICINYFRVYKNNKNFKKSVAKKMNEIL